MSWCAWRSCPCRGAAWCAPGAGCMSSLHHEGCKATGSASRMPAAAQPACMGLGGDAKAAVRLCDSTRWPDCTHPASRSALERCHAMSARMVTRCRLQLCLLKLHMGCRQHWAAGLALGGVLCWQLHGFLQLLGHPATWLEAGLLAALLIVLPFAAPPMVHKIQVSHNVGSSLCNGLDASCHCSRPGAGYLYMARPLP